MKQNQVAFFRGEPGLPKPGLMNQRKYLCVWEAVQYCNDDAPRMFGTRVYMFMCGA